MFEKNTPRDFFLHAGAFITLYFGAIALVTLLFSVINVAFPDPLQPVYYSDPYSGPVRFSIASLLVLAPITVYFFYLIQSEARRIPARRTLGVRKWLTYITLFIAGATVIGDVIILLNSFLGGTLPTAFLLKIAVILAIMGAGFGYFLLDIRGYWAEHADQSHYMGYGVIGVVLASIIGGMMLIGSPMTQRAMRVDAQQTADLQQISQMVVANWQKKQALPLNLESLNNDITGERAPIAPSGQPAYEYTATADLSFKLCATFLTDSSGAGSYSPYLEQGFTEPPQWDHKAEYTCFERTIDPQVFQPPTGMPTKLPPSKIQPTPTQAPLE